MLLAGVVMVTGAVAASIASRTRVPILVVFLALGMALGSEGPGGIDFDDPDLARSVGVLGLVAILFEGGLTTAWSDIRGLLVPTVVLATAGVTLTAGVVGLVAFAVFDVPIEVALLLGAVVGSTDAAAVFSTLRSTNLKRRVASLLEAESGANDPMAVALTIGLIEFILEPAYGLRDMLLLLAGQLGMGLTVGLVLGAVAFRAFERAPGGLVPFAPALSLGAAAVSFGAADVLGGSGFLSVYVVGLFIGNCAVPFQRTMREFHGGLAVLSQVMLFVALGLLVFPSRLLPIALPGLVVAAALLFVARPFAVWICTVRQGFPFNERVLLGWAGLRGAVPIVLATFALSSEVVESNTIFNGVFFVVIVSALVQGPTLEPLARRLGLSVETRPFYVPPLKVADIHGADLVEYVVHDEEVVAGVTVADLGVREVATVTVIVREEQSVLPDETTVLLPGDRIYMLVRSKHLAKVERTLKKRREASPDRTGDDAS
ncbi:MAG: potassium/proton antiporter [Actinomycetota bacterium]